MVVFPLQVRIVCDVRLEQGTHAHADSGPKRYDYDAEKDNWYYARDGRALGDLLNEELSKALDQKVDLGLSNVSSL